MTGVHYEVIEDGGVCTPAGFKAASVTAGLKKSGKADMGLIACDVPTRFAAAFTQNSFAAPPVLYCREICREQARIRALVMNSGNANACTGRQGFLNTKMMATRTADLLEVEQSEVMVFSTGRIGVPLPMDIINSGIDKLADGLSDDANWEIAEAIMTTDTVPKSIAIELDIDGEKIRIGGIAKGAGMIAPQMKVEREKHATMFCFITTDARVDDGVLADTLDASLNRSFNRITVDGDTSTNDSFVVMSSELANNPPIRKGSIEAEQFQQAFDFVAGELAKWLVKDGEGVTKFVEVSVCGAQSDSDAEKAARAIGDSLLCKTAWFGADPNWGRILDAAGYAGIDIDPDRVSLRYQDIVVVRNGLDAGETEEDLAKLMKADEFRIELDLGLGTGEFTIWTCDLSYDYVKVNADYHT